MNWEQKSEMCKHFNSEQYDKALDLVIDNIDSMDEQSWDMFFTGIELTNESIKPFIDKHKIICDKTKNETSSSFRTALRMSCYETLVTQILLENSK